MVAGQPSPVFFLWALVVWQIWDETRIVGRLSWTCEANLASWPPRWPDLLYWCFFQVNESEIERNLSAEEHRAKSQAYQLAEQRVQELQRNLKRSIHKSRYPILLNDFSLRGCVAQRKRSCNIISIPASGTSIAWPILLDYILSPSRLCLILTKFDIEWSLRI